MSAGVLASESHKIIRETDFRKFSDHRTPLPLGQWVTLVELIGLYRLTEFSVTYSETNRIRVTIDDRVFYSGSKSNMAILSENKLSELIITKNMKLEVFGINAYCTTTITYQPLILETLNES
ncbi:hypothetical protein [Vibrio vulnificus]|uniref:hypothetical protein n=1 Tax=Vibrio vulnificus TaxID=672 RepID=UPI001F0336B2|nr:hypothetical protein [Vibrio vulnificus]MCG9651484.1 hypothetical protein [Vibrio vulnificus]